MARKPDHFELAAMQTLAKVNKVGSCVNAVTIGPNSTQNISESLLYDETTSFKCTERRKTFLNESKKENKEEDNMFFSYAAQALHEMENLRQLEVSDKVKEFASKLMRIEDELSSRMAENLKLTREETRIKNKLKLKMIENSIRDEDLVLSKRIRELMKRHADSKAKSEEQTTNEVNEKIKAEENIKLQNEYVKMLSQIQQEYHKLHKQILDHAMNCKNRAKLISQANSDFHKIEELTNNFNSILQKINLKELNIEIIETCRMMLQCASVIADKVKKNSEQINFEEEKRIQLEQQKEQIEQIEAVPTPALIPQPVQHTDSEELNKSEENETNLEQYIFNESLEFYVALINEYEEFYKHVEAFVRNAPSKLFLNKLKVAVGTSVNTAHSADISRMRDKFIKLSNFLRGNFTLPNIQMPSLPKDTYFVFIVDYLSKHFIAHAEKRFTLTSPFEAFIQASLALALWSKFPKFGRSLLAHIMKKCPYTIPAYWPRYSGQTNQEYNISLGYNYKDDVIEEESSFESRMVGIFMLYVSLIVTPVRTQPHPYGLENAWMWIAAVINLDPRPNITASLLRVFLEVCGYKMHQRYGIQFRKIIQLLVDEYIAKIDAVTPANHRGPAEALKLYVEKIRREGFQNPKDIISADNWF